jgi:copper transport protein
VVGTPALSLSTNVGDDLVTLSLDPASPGIAQLALVIQDSTGAPVQGAVATVTYAVENAGTSTVELSRTGPGKFAGNVSAAAGRTTATVILASPDQPPAAATFAFDMPVRGARDILARAEAAMNGLQSLREHQSLEGLPGETLVAEYAYLAPLEMQVVSNDGEVIAVGTQRFERRGATWTVGAWPDPAGFRWPAFSFGQAEDDVSLLGIEMLGGQPAFRVTFADRQQVRYSLWIDTASFYVLQEEIMAPGHYERATFSDFDAPLTIELPDVPVVGS